MILVPEVEAHSEWQRNRADQTAAIKRQGISVYGRGADVKGECSMIWKRIDCFPDYLVSNTGLIQNIASGAIKNTYSDRAGYRLVHLKRDGRQFTQKVHRLVALSFIPNPENKPTVNHINEVKDDNRVENLEWATYREQIFHGTRNDRAMKSIGSRPVFRCDENGKILERYESVRDASRKMQVKPEQIINCIKGIHKTSAGFYWKYESENSDFSKGIIRNRAVIQMNADGEVIARFPSIQKAARAIGRSPSNVCLCLQGKRHQCCGFRWEYASEETEEIKYLQNLIDSKKTPVLQFSKQGDFLRRYDSVSAAARAVGISTGDICRVLKGRRKTSGGYKWEYAA